MLKIDNIEITDEKLSGNCCGKEKNYKCYNLTEFNAKNSKIEIDNAIIAVSYFPDKNMSEKLFFAEYFTDYNNFKKIDKVFPNFHTKIIPLKGDDLKQIDKIIQDLEKTF
ncbi:hypothetical protein V3468_08345 [Flavobacterium oreochromis]